MNSQAVYISALGSGATLVGNLFMLLAVVGTGLAIRRFGVRRMHVVLSAAMIGASLAVLACDVSLPSVGVAGGVLLAGLDFFTLGACMMLWGIAFASLERRLAVHNVVMTVAVSVAIILAIQAGGHNLPVSWLTEALTAASGAIMLGGRVALRNQSRAPCPRPRRQVALLVAQRAVCGLSIGLSPGAIGSLLSRQFDPVVMAVCLLACVALAAHMARTGTGEPHDVLLALLVLVAPFSRGGETAMLGPLFATL